MSSERADERRSKRRRSHHWYWVAAVPATFLLWVATLTWLALADSWVPFDVGANTVEVSLVALGVPFVVLTAYLPLAVYRDADYVNRTSGQWAPNPIRQALLAAVGLVVLVVTGVPLLLVGAPTSAIVLGFVVSVPFAVYYLRKRREHLGVPDVPW